MIIKRVIFLLTAGIIGTSLLVGCSKKNNVVIDNQNQVTTSSEIENINNTEETNKPTDNNELDNKEIKTNAVLVQKQEESSKKPSTDEKKEENKIDKPSNNNDKKPVNTPKEPSKDKPSNIQNTKPENQKPQNEKPNNPPNHVEKPQVNKPIEVPVQNDDVYLARVEEEIFNATNAERQKNGLPPFKRNATATKYARSKSLEMLNLGYFDHKSPKNGYIYDIAKRDGWNYSNIGENIYKMTGGQASNVSGAAITNSWMNSEGHRKNILNSKFEYLGVGVTYRDGKLYATQVFYTPL